jgi:hypothetical protein
MIKVLVSKSLNKGKSINSSTISFNMRAAEGTFIFYLKEGFSAMAMEIVIFVARQYYHII